MKVRGFTLIEVMVAIAIVALITAVAIPGFNYAFRTSSQTFSSQMASLFRESRDQALLRHQLIRVKFDLTKQEYWVEAAPGSYLLPSEAESKKALEEKDRFKDDKEKKEEAFTLARELTPKKRGVPYGVKIIKILSPRYKESVTEGDAEIYYMPSGLSDAAILHIEDMEKNQHSLLINPITGITKLEQGLNEGATQ